jgi:hypothetical protein
MIDSKDAAQTVANFDIGAASQAADEMAQVFELASERIADALQSAAQTGEFSFSQMTESIARDLANLAVQELVTGPLEGIFERLISNDFRSSTPSQSPMNITLNLSGVNSVSEFKKSETQISAGLVRVLSQGRKLI